MEAGIWRSSSLKLKEINKANKVSRILYLPYLFYMLTSNEDLSKVIFSSYDFSTGDNPESISPSVISYCSAQLLMYY